MISKLKKNKRGQAQSVIIFFMLVVAIFMVSIIVLRITNSVITPFSQVLNNTSPQGSQAVDKVQERFTTFWDIAVVLMFFVNVMILFVSSFLIDIHPAFVILYIFALIFLFICGNFALYSLDNVWELVGTDVETAQTPIQQFILNNFNLILIGIFVLSGVIMYAKFKLFSGMGTGGNY